MKVAKLVKFAEFKRDENGRVLEVIPGALRYDDDPIPECGADDVLLRVLSFGICASDIQIYHGMHMAVTEDKLPRVMGHEVSAVIEKVGSNVTGWEVGEKVSVEPQVYCGKCYPCQTGRFNVCEHLEVMGVHRDGFNCEYYALNPKYLHKVPQDMSVEHITVVEPLAVGVGSIKRSTKFKGGNVCVVGAGTIGNCVAQAAKGLGAGQVLVTDINQDKLDYALECGVDYAVNTKNVTLKEAIEQSFGMRKADVIIDCVAAPPVFQTILDATRPDSEIIITGNYKADVTFAPTRIQRREVNILGHMMYVREDFADAIRLLADGKINTEKFISQRWEFDQYLDALKFADSNPLEYMKMIVKVTDL